MRMRKTLLITLVASLLTVWSVLESQSQSNPQSLKLVDAARDLIKMSTRYDGSYVKIDYPGGDPPIRMGVCSDIVVRSYRKIGLDLQVLVHKDILKNFNVYPLKKIYGQSKSDTNIDHRRVPNLMTFFKRHAQSLTISTRKNQLGQWQGGDIVVFDLFNNKRPSHIGIISERKANSGMPLVLHHYPPLPTEEDCLTKWKIIGHYRYFPDK